ncbi:MAG: hypothetical protein GQ565_10095 [Candidatus Aegiribacteria sp.]|nr:hypothetical protein [Candidatus Aegiribacteria sp.]
MKDREDLNELNFEEFLEICSDSGLIEEGTAREIINFAKSIGGVGAVTRFTGEQLSSTGDFAASLVSIYPEDMSFNNYVTTEENYYATEIARTIALIPRVWKSITPIMLHADTGQGKTHLLAAIARTTNKRTLVLNTVDLQIEYQHCLNAGMDRELRDWITSYELLMLDDIQFSQGDLQFQKFLISIINRMPRGKHGIITSSDVHPAELLDIDSSFYSRLTSGIIIRLETVNFEGRKEILRNLFSQTGIRPDDAILEFVAANVKMNVRQLKAAGRMVLAQMLGPAHGVSIEMVKDILRFMQIHEKDEHRPKASELNVKEEKEIETTVDPTPYIVVDIDEEIRTQKTPAETREAVEPAEAAGVDNDEHVFREETVQPPLQNASSDTVRYKDMVESAQTVERQTEALKQAVADRIEQLEKKNADSSEIDKLRFALTFLNEGKLESAMIALKPD